MGVAALVPAKTITPLPAPLPVSAFGNTALRDSVTKALAAVPSGQRNAFLDVSNKGAGVMLAHRSKDGWAIVGAGRYNFEDKGVDATVAVSW